MAHKCKNIYIFLLPRIDFDKQTPLYCFTNNWLKNEGLSGQHVKMTIIKGNNVKLNLTQLYWCEGLYFMNVKRYVPLFWEKNCELESYHLALLVICFSLKH